MRPVVVGGIDPSYTCTSCVLLLMDGVHKTQRVQKLPAASSHPQRLARIRNDVRDFFTRHLLPDLICIEGYAHGAKFGREQAGELGGVLRVALWEAGLTYANIAPLTLKKWITGSGKGEKSLILREVFRKWNYEAIDDNDADAYGLAKLAEAMCQPGKWTKKFAQLVKKVEVVPGFQRTTERSMTR